MAEAAYVKHRVPELCRHFLRGRCRFGSACRFSHQREDVALPFGHRQYVQSQASHAIRGNEGGWRFRVLSYNVLADCLAQEHKELYTSAPRFSLEWSFRSRLIIREILHHSPDIVCLQEVDRFPEFQHALQPHGYEGVFTKRTGDRSDGLAMFWRINAMQPVDQRFLRFKDLGMKDNVAQLLVFQRRESLLGAGFFLRCSKCGRCWSTSTACACSSKRGAADVLLQW
ncbi:hypothetical protein CHLNCDRAFT_50978 [Chlorella variabilis]|uniref:C3H1-type domain-containing protein n=1 Tax=Chlorella variabilis TaxID=554065 RepID=E1Z925_CHLVA|nr:hypothetical protein CHLNCDRAFT_50978 [Chlorella variabilis]EFN57442.1 hypothetical protein CHLNCDRAFT_50978 [Chlorella variabilis]|eukprot:XP_005849544.1 hypothetical protein CHLNCDRAFT_50978 [Chlorella variabilis]